MNQIKDEILKKVYYFDLGLIGYKEAFDLQLNLFEIVKNKNLTGVILLLEHNPVITIGSSSNISNIIASPKELEEQQIELYHTDRGGDVTFHGPGQLICYPIFNLENFNKDLSTFVYKLEQVIIDSLSFLNIKARRIEKLRGVFVQNNKIASIGIHIKKWVTYHGFSFNINVKLDYFKNIIACGLKDYPQTSLQTILGKTVSIELIKELVIRNFEKVFNIKAIKSPYTLTDFIKIISS